MTDGMLVVDGGQFHPVIGLVLDVSVPVTINRMRQRCRRTGAKTVVEKRQWGRSLTAQCRVMLMMMMIVIPSAACADSAVNEQMAVLRLRGDVAEDVGVHGSRDGGGRR